MASCKNDFLCTLGQRYPIFEQLGPAALQVTNTTFFELKQMKWIINIFLNCGCYKDMNMNKTLTVEWTFFQFLFQPLKWFIPLRRSWCSLPYCILYWCKAPYASPLRSFCPQAIWSQSLSPLSNLLHRLKNKKWNTKWAFAQKRDIFTCENITVPMAS